ncbi:phosphoribosylaminoimidazolesuccinocarboxamide synthase [Arcanobacterium pinnipediorum]|uniref:Phosphoribosylaminoimidazole-succinocarboxamide synthase n=1 Tax=Arcanobacterium pinnipediorum TaxID=1503041 RepID=A0ABY5AHL0_9ACTO|nr:phosphoribosylaminoimidazolesuccinocarboxamide synthase [Arcanobacterium pinnipediorum]USR79582.1 phosphoribosylaminoimidazolesuccinocarboxamide synthase [Arcanobacterium pinnipediorum]
MSGFAGGISIPGWSRIYAGKVRDMYIPIDQQWHDGHDTMLIVASDRISVQDRVIPSIIPGKGQLQTALTMWWFNQLDDIVPNHLSTMKVPDEVRGRAMIVQRLRMYPVECSVVGYMTAALYDEYQRTGSINGVELPQGLREGDKLPSPLFLPARKGAVQANDIDISFEDFAYIVGLELARAMRSISIDIYLRGHEMCARSGIVLADCKLEFGSSADAGDEEIVLADEVLTPDSATMWLAQDYAPGKPQIVMGKQFIGHWLRKCGWDRDAGTPPPPLPRHLVTTVKKRYETVYSMLTGEK